MVWIGWCVCVCVCSMEDIRYVERYGGWREVWRYYSSWDQTAVWGAWHDGYLLVHTFSCVGHVPLCIAYGGLCTVLRPPISTHVSICFYAVSSTCAVISGESVGILLGISAPMQENHTNPVFCHTFVQHQVHSKLLL